METTLPAPRVSHLQQSKIQYGRRKTTNVFMLSLMGLMTLLALVPLFWIVGYVVYKGSMSLNLAFFHPDPAPDGDGRGRRSACH